MELRILEMDMVKVYMIENRDVFVICPHCGADNSLNLSHIVAEARFQNTMDLDCQCGRKFSVFLDRRKFYRKPVNLTGLCFSTGDPKEGVPVRILDISMSGVCFFKEIGKKLTKDEKIQLQLVLDVSDDRIISPVVTINIRANNIGAKFINLDEHSRKILGFFLLP